MRRRVARSRELVAQGRPAAVVARVAGISRQAIYRRPARPPAGQRRPLDDVDRAVLEVARENPTDGSRMVAALAARDLRAPVNRKRVQRLMREHRLTQPKRSEGRRRRPGYFQVTRPRRALAHGHDLDLGRRARLGLSERDHRLLHPRDHGPESRCPLRATEALTVVDRAVAERGIGAGALTLGSDNGTAYTSRAFRARLADLGIVHRRGGYRDPESQAFIESWFSKLKLRCVWREEFETLNEAREKIDAYINRYHRRPHSRMNYKTPLEVAATRQDPIDQSIPAA